MPRAGGTSAEFDLVTPGENSAMIISSCEQIKSDLEVKLNKTLAVFEPKRATQQVVAGMNFFVKIHIGNDEYVHVRVFKPLPVYGDKAELHGVQVGKKAADPVEYFAQ